MFPKSENKLLLTSPWWPDRSWRCVLARSVGRRTSSGRRRRCRRRPRRKKIARTTSRPKQPRQSAKPASWSSFICYFDSTPIPGKVRVFQNVSQTVFECLTFTQADRMWTDFPPWSQLQRKRAKTTIFCNFQCFY